MLGCNALNRRRQAVHVLLQRVWLPLREPLSPPRGALWQWVSRTVVALEHHTFHSRVTRVRFTHARRSGGGKQYIEAALAEMGTAIDPAV
eukprot:COSAG05_NODE_10386_length_568_cov_0.970149_1_plen_89_part_10